jgi:signal transduction histidine kinase
MRLFRSLRSAVLLFVVLPLLGVLIALGTLGLRGVEQQVTQRLQDDIELVARSIRLPVAAAMARRDAAAVQEALDSIFEIDQVFGAYVYDETGRRVAANGPRSPSLDRRREARAVTAEGSQGAFDERPERPVFSFFLPLLDASGQSIGLLQVTRDISPFHSFLTRLRLQGAIAMAAVAILILIVVLAGHQRAVGRHVRTLAEILRRLGDGERGLRVPAAGADELRLLAASINTMVERREESERTVQAQRARQAALEEELRHAEKLAAIGRLAAGIAHELGTPLAIVAGRAQRAARALPEDGPARSELASLQGELARVIGIVRQLLDFARRNPLQSRRLSLAAVLSAAVARVIRQAGEPPVSIEIAGLERAASVRLEADPLRLEQALGNLVENAVAAAHRCVQIDYEVSPEQLAIRVTDDGPGIVAPDLERLFEPFFTTKPAGQGTGLGLAIARAAIEAHGGHLWLDRSWQSGARFVVALPWRPATHRSEEALARDAC